jgi:hypothetical protein
MIVENTGFYDVYTTIISPHLGTKHLSVASPGLDPGAHVFIPRRPNPKTWMAGSSPAKKREARITSPQVFT